MIRTSTHHRLAAAAALLLIVTACGDGSDTDTGDLPPAPSDVADDVSTEPACLPDEPDCDDTIVVPDEGQDLESPDGTSVSSSGMTVDGGLTVEEALTRSADNGIIAVKGFFYHDATGTFLCSLLAESLPPLCGGAILELDGSAAEAITAEINNAQGVQWTDQTVSLFGIVSDGVLTVDTTVTG